MSGTLENVTLTAPDISCGHCVATINKVIGGLDGVRRVEASEQTKRVQVEFDPGKISLAQIEATMDEEGYPVQK